MEENTIETPVRDEARRRFRWFEATVLAAGVIAGITFAQYVFPEAGLARQIAGGCIAGLYFAMCAIPEKLME